MTDRSTQISQREANNTTRRRKRELTTDDNYLNLDEARDGMEVRQHKRAKFNKDTGKKPPSTVHESGKKLHSFDRDFLVLENDLERNKDMKTTGDEGNMVEDHHETSDIHAQYLGRKDSESPVTIEQLCAGGVSEMFLLKRTGSGPSVMLMKVAHDLAQKFQEQIVVGERYRRAKDISLPGLDQLLRMNKARAESLVLRVQTMVKIKGDRKPTPEEERIVQWIREETRNLEFVRKETETKRSTLLRDIQSDRRAWENAAKSVEESLQKVFVQSGLNDEAVVADNAITAPQDDKVKHNEPSLEEGQPDAKPAGIGPLDSSRVRIKLEETKTRIELRKAQREHDDHRNTFRRGLLVALAAAAQDRPDAPKRLIEEEFSRNYVRAGTELAGLVTRAQAAREAVLVAAAEADVSIIGSDDDMEPNFPYDLEELAAVKEKCLDRYAVQEWIEAIEASSKPNLRPSGYVLHMAEKWKRAAEEEDDVSSSGEDFMLNAGVEPRREAPPTQDSVLKLASKSKSWHAEPYWSFSDCAEGKKRRRIDDWTRRIRQPVG